MGEQMEAEHNIESVKTALSLEEVAHFTWMAARLNLHNPEASDEPASFGWLRNDSVNVHPGIVPLKVLQWAEQKKYNFTVEEFQAQVVEGLKDFEAFLAEAGFENFEGALETYKTSINELTQPSTEDFATWKDQQQSRYLRANDKWNAIADQMNDLSDDDFNELYKKSMEFIAPTVKLKENYDKKLEAIKSRPLLNVLFSIYHKWRTYTFKEEFEKNRMPEKSPTPHSEPMYREEGLEVRIGKVDIGLLKELDSDNFNEIIGKVKQLEGSSFKAKAEIYIAQLINDTREATAKNPEINSETAYLQIFAIVKKIMFEVDAFEAANPQVVFNPESISKPDMQLLIEALMAAAREQLDHLDYDISLPVLEHVARQRRAKN